VVAAFGASEGIGLALSDGARLRLGDEWVEVIHTPAHTDDSICLYSEETGALFAGDTPLLNLSPDADYGPPFVAALARIVSRPVNVIYFGHGDPLTENCNRQLERSLRALEVK